MLLGETEVMLVPYSTRHATTGHRQGNIHYYISIHDPGKNIWAYVETDNFRLADGESDGSNQQSRGNRTRKNRNDKKVRNTRNQRDETINGISGRGKVKRVSPNVSQ